MKKLLLTIALVFTTLLVLTGCTSKKVDPLVGKWAYGSYVYTFNEDKSGEYDVSGTIKKFTWEVKDNKLSFLYEGNTSPMELEYRIEDKTLIIKDSFGSEVKYEKK